MAAVDFNALRAQTMGAGQDDAVTVNTRALIDKVLARYSGEWTVLRELLQNAADASASKVKIRFDTLPSLTVPLPQTQDASALLRHTLLHHTLKSLHVTNNGNVFGAHDWDRLKRIAEGNPDETKIGAFGVGFYSVFDSCEEPFVQSGKEAMAFYWKENALFTRRLQLPEAQATPDTTFVLDYRDTTSAVPSLLSICQFLVGSMTFVGLTEIELWLDKWKIIHLNKLNAPGVAVTIPRALNTRTTEKLMKVERVSNETAQLSARYLSVIGWKPQTQQQSHTAESNPQATSSLRTFFNKFSASAQRNAAAEKAAREEKAAQEALSEKLVEEQADALFMRVSRADISTNVGKNFAQELERATKKPPPKMTKVAIMTASYVGEDSGLSVIGEKIFASVIPSKNGRIFIGQITNQTTGLSAHISAQSVIPTVEREAIDLQARWVRTWNQELLRACGIVCRLTWLGEIESVRQGIAQSMKQAGRDKSAPEDIDKVLPEAIHVLNSFTFRDSTPSGQIGTIVEEAFWTCNSASSIEILSSRGVKLSQDVRLGTSELSFVEGIPVVPSQLLDKAGGFVRKLIEYGIITDVTPGDIRKELEKQALTSKQLTEFMKWITEKVKASELDTPAAQSLLDVTVANDDEASEPIIMSQINTFLNPAKIPPNVPIPPSVIPYKYTSGLDRANLEGLGWNSLEIVPWVRWLLGNADNRNVLAADKDLLSSPDFAGQVLPIISKQWDGLSQSSKQTIINLLKSKTVMPTKLGMRTPAESYFPSVRLFDDLPVITVGSVKEKFALALGVRKTIDLNLVFERLLNHTESAKGDGKTWNHVDLVKYLASVRNDIPADDIKRLKETPLCPAETPDGPSKELYKASDLFEPNDELRALKIKVLQWPGIFRPNTEDGKFLRQIGLRNHPNTSELIQIAYKAVASKTLQEQDHALHNRVIRYIVAFHVAHGYSTREIAATTLPFLPLEGEKNSTAIPSKCFTNVAIASMGFPILRKDLHMYADKLGVKENMPIDAAVMWLIQNPPESHRRARELFDYFATRLNELHGEPLEMLRQAKIVPISRSTGHSKMAYLRPDACFLGASGKYGDIFDYVDFGSVANAFLLRLGAKSDPTTAELAWLVVREPARIFSTFNSPERYQDLLTQLAVSWAALKKDKELVSAMKRAPFLLAYRELPPAYKADARSLLDEDDDEQEAIKTYQLASAKQIIIIDDAVNYSIFRDHLLAAPMDDTLESFYNALGVTNLSAIVDMRSRVGPPLRDQRSAQSLKRLILERMKLFFHGMSKEQIRHDTNWLDNKLQYVAVQSISVRKSLRGTDASYDEKRSAVIDPQAGQLVLCIIADIRDMYEVSNELLKLCLYVPKPERAIILTSLFDSSLQLLRQRGYPVDRILRRRQQEARIAEEARLRHIEEEEKRLAQEARNSSERALEHSHQNPQGSRNSRHAAMPGAFDNELEERNQSGGNTSLWSQFSDMIKGDKRRPQLSGPQTNVPLPPEAPAAPTVQGGATKGPTSQVGRPITQPHELQQNLLSAIKASRPHNGQGVVSNPHVNEVAETSTFCDTKPAQNIRHLAEVGKMKVFISNKLDEASAASFLARNGGALTDFANILQTLALSLNLAPSSMHIYYDDDSNTIAFNSNKALFFNYRYFENLHLPDVQQGKKADALIYWFVTLAHELSHNLVADHSAAHSFYTESFIAAFFSKVAQSAFGSGNNGTGSVANAQTQQPTPA